MKIIRLERSDTERFLRLRGEGLRSDPQAFRGTVEDDLAVGVAGWEARLAAGRVLAVTEGEAWLGIGGISRISGARLDHKALVWGMYVVPEARGSGVADTLMTALIDAGRGWVRQLQLTVMADNRRARAFYERHGFALYGIEPESVAQADGFGDEALMWRKL